MPERDRSQMTRGDMSLEIDRLRAEAEKLRAEREVLVEDSDAYQAVVAVMVDYWFAQSSMTLAEAVQKERDEAREAFQMYEGVAYRERERARRAEADAERLAEALRMIHRMRPDKGAKLERACEIAREALRQHEERGKNETLAGVKKSELYKPISEVDQLRQELAESKERSAELGIKLLRAREKHDALLKDWPKP